MRIGVLGTGMVGKAISGRLVELGHEVCMGSRAAGGEAATEWVAAAGDGASEGAFEDAAAFGEIVFNCTNGMGTLAAVEQAGAANLDGKVLVDVANPLDFSGDDGMRLSVCNTDSLGEQVQRAVPGARVVKALNTMNNSIMVNPQGVPGDHVALMCGDHDDAKQLVRGILGEFGWPDERIVDLGGLRAARGQEMFLPLWVDLMRAQGTGAFNIALMR